MRTRRSLGSDARTSIETRRMSGRSMARNMPISAAGQMRNARDRKRTGPTGQRCATITARRNAQERHRRRWEASRLACLLAPDAQLLSPISWGLPDGMQERIGDKEVGVLTLTLSGNNHRFAMIRPVGLRRHNILDHTQLYPGIAALRARLGA